ncbi:MAG: type II toxin-antitoxin system PemK/MazF family toxin [Verrucomicrobiae bacterium]|nr:type II toxin-antitoxin system PemK/MazF family toxin [Verrucomicrobiae bacterium]MCP5539679.1 type II toxin-antitoxin system PemK/MazF family toxin [Akkermansiaceae bacterium]MCP5549418.1 type II toxin-antitoxin system PemK/MazF family toxin [Akkermansiaceae bacterium]
MVLEGEIVVAKLPQADGASKLRPVVLLRELPGFGDFLVCGVSSQLRQAVPDFDEVIHAGSMDFQKTGLKVSSVVRLAFLAVIPVVDFKRRLGKVSPEILDRLRGTLSQ